jgi:hypothetical protein
MLTEKDMQDKYRDELYDTQWVMGTMQGRRFVWRLLSYAGIYQCAEGDIHQALRQEGKRQGGLFLLGIISDASEEEVFMMMREAKDRDLEEKLKHDNANTNKSATSYTDIDDLVGSGSFPSYSSGSLPDF